MAAASLSFPTHTTPGLTPPSARASLEALPASARTVFGLLRERGPLTHKDLLRDSGLPGRTVRWAVTRLKDEGLIRSRFNLRDSRQVLYFPAAEVPATAAWPAMA